jgi:hypothetical protein
MGINQSSTKELSAYRSREDLRKERRNSISYLLLNCASITEDLDALWKGLQAAQLAHTQTAILPVERSNRGTGLGLNGPGWLALRQLE